MHAHLRHLLTACIVPVLLLYLVSQVHAQRDLTPNTDFNPYFEQAYEAHPRIPRGVLEAVAHTYTRIRHIRPDEEAASCFGIPPTYGVMGLTLNGKGHFRENLRTVSELSGIPIKLIVEDPATNIRAYAVAYDTLLRELAIGSDDVMDHLPVLRRLSELPATSQFDAFAWDSYVYVLLRFLNKTYYQRVFDFPAYDMDIRGYFGENYPILSAPRVLMGSSVILTGDTLFRYMPPKDFGASGTYLNPGDEQDRDTGRRKRNPNHLHTQNTDYSGAIWDPTSCNYNSRGSTPITDVTIHTMQGSYSGSISWFKNCSAKVSAHYNLRASDGQITQMVKEIHRAWHVGNSNSKAIGLEHEGYIADPRWYTTATYNASSALVQDICQRRNINPLTAYDGPGHNGVHVLSQNCIRIKGHQHFPANTHVDPGQYWDWHRFFNLLNPNVAVQTISSTSGNLTDSGGATGNYGDHERTRWLIQPSNASEITLTFQAFDVEKDYDFLRIYDGTDNDGVLIGEFTGTQLPQAVTAYSGAMFLDFYSDCATTGAGWQASWQTQTASASCPVPTNLNASFNGHSMATLSWDPVPGATDYEVKMKHSIGPNTWYSFSSPTNQYRHTGLTSNRLYYWQVIAHCGSDQSGTASSRFLTPNPASVTISECNGSFNDTGGGLGHYANNEDYTITIDPGATSLTMRFTSFETYSSHDKLYIYNGGSTSAPLIGSYHGKNSPGIVTASSGKMTLRFKSNGWYSDPGWSATWTCVQQNCDAPSQLSAADLTDHSAKLKWAPVSGAGSYEIQFKPVNSSTWQTVASGGSSYTLGGLNPATTYQWRVKSLCASKNSVYSPTTTFTTLPPQPCLPPTSTTTQQINPTSATFTWSSVSNAVSYEVRHKKDSWFAFVWTTEPQTGNTQLTVSGLNPDTDYIWQVRSHCAQDVSSYTASTPFTTPLVPPCNIPAALTNQNISTVTAVVAWQAVGAATSYVIEYKKTSASSWQSVSTSSTDIQLTNLTPATDYVWRVKAVCGSSDSGLSGQKSFKTQSGCWDPHENNNSSTGATVLAINSTKYGRICGAGDVDWFQVNLTSNADLTVSLKNLPKDYNMELYVNAAYQSGSYNGGTNPEEIKLTNTPAGTYLFRVYGQGNVFDDNLDYTIEATSNTVSPCPVPVGLKTQSLTHNSATVTWASVSQASSYVLVYKSTNSSTWSSPVTVNGTQHTLSGLNPDTNYEFQVRSNCSMSSSNLSPSAHFKTTNVPVCDVPTGLSHSNITAASAQVSWNAANGAVSYTVRMKPTSASNWSSITTTATYYPFSNLSPATTYEWQVQSNCASGNSAFSGLDYYTTPVQSNCHAPTGLSQVMVGSGSATVTWNSVANASGYEIRYKPASASSWITQNVNQAPAVLNNLAASTAYEWSVRSICGSSTSTYSTPATFTTQSGCVDLNEPNNSSTQPAPLPLNTTVPGKICPAGDADWFKVTLATTADLTVTLSNLPANYHLERYTQTSWAGGSYNSGLANETMTIQNAAPGDYWFRVYGYNGAQDPHQDYAISASIPTPTPCSQPAGLMATNITASTAQLQWNAVGAATGYIVRIKPSTSTNWTVYTSTPNHYALSNLVATTAYDWQVAAVCGNNQLSTFTTPQTFTTNSISCKPPVAVSTTQVTSNTAVVNWQAVTGATSYTLQYRQTGNPNWQPITGLTGTTHTLNGLTDGTQYEWKINAICASQATGYSNILQFTTQPTPCAIPGNLSTTGITLTGAQLSWDLVPGAASYQVRYRPTASATWTTVSTGANSYTLTGLIAATAYEWQVNATCGSNTTGFSNSEPFTTLSPCPQPTAGLSSSGITTTDAQLSWNAVSGALSYEVRYRESSSPVWNGPMTTASTGYALTGLNSGTTYDWEVRALCSSGASSYSPTQQFTTLVPCQQPTGLSSSAITLTGATVSWNAVPTATSYEVRYRPSSTSVWSGPMTTAGTSLNLSGLTQATAYDWSVQAQCPVGPSGYTSNQNFTTLAPCPVPVSGLNTGSVTYNSAVASWGSVAGASSYDLRYREVGAPVWTGPVNTTNLNYTLSGLIGLTAYEWEVQAQCASGPSGFSTAQIFTTLDPCPAPAGLVSSNMTTTGATLSWNAVTNATDYTVFYKPSASSTWSTTTTTSTTEALSGLSAATTYDWKIQAICPAGNSLETAVENFTTQGTCFDPHESNNSSTSATALAPNSSLQGKICPSGENDWFKVTLPSATNLQITLTNLPDNYNIEYFGTGCGTCYVSGSYNTGTANETININGLSPNTYFFKVYGHAGASNDLLDYTITATTSAIPFREQMFNSMARDGNGLLRSAYPNPSRGLLNLEYELTQHGPVRILVLNLQGRLVTEMVTEVRKAGVHQTTLNLSDLPPSVYIVRLVANHRQAAARIVLKP